MEVQWEETREATLAQFKMAKFAKSHFINGNVLTFTKEALKGPLISKTKDMDKTVWNIRNTEDHVMTDWSIVISAYLVSDPEVHGRCWEIGKQGKGLSSRLIFLTCYIWHNGMQSNIPVMTSIFKNLEQLSKNRRISADIVSDYFLFLISIQCSLMKYRNQRMIITTMVLWRNEAPGRSSFAVTASALIRPPRGNPASAQNQWMSSPLCRVSRMMISILFISS